MIFFPPSFHDKFVSEDGALLRKKKLLVHNLVPPQNASHAIQYDHIRSLGRSPSKKRPSVSAEEVRDAFAVLDPESAERNPHVYDHAPRWLHEGTAHGFVGFSIMRPTLCSGGVAPQRNSSSTASWSHCGRALSTKTT